MTVRFRTEKYDQANNRVIDHETVLGAGQVSEFDQSAVQRYLLYTKRSSVHYTVTGFVEGAGGEIVVTGKDVITPTFILHFFRALFWQGIQEPIINDVSITKDLSVGDNYFLQDETIMIGE